MIPILPLKEFEVGTPERRLAQFLNAWAARDWERLARNCVALYRNNPGYAVQRLKQFFGHQSPKEQGESIDGATKEKGVDLTDAEIVLSKSKGPYAKVVVEMHFIRRGDGRDPFGFGEVFTFELVREDKKTGDVDPVGAWYVIPKFEVYAEQCFDADNIFGDSPQSIE